jgi:hypothetical protein
MHLMKITFSLVQKDFSINGSSEIILDKTKTEDFLATTIDL